jgi:cytochrome P450
MVSYADVLRGEDARINHMFDVEAETLQTGGQIIDDPFPSLQQLLAKAPVQKGSVGELLGYGPAPSFQFHIPGKTTYSAFSFRAVSRCLIENETFSSHGYRHFPQNANFHMTFLQKVGAEHRRLRSPVQPLFNPEAAQNWWSKKIIDETVEVLISKIETKKSADLFLELCARMPMHVVSAGFGIAPEDIVPYRAAILGTTDHHASPESRKASMEKANEIMRGVINERRKAPQDDIISKFVEAEIELDDGSVRPFTDEEIVGHCQLILLAGGGTTWRQLGITIFALLNDPEQLEALKADRSLLPNTILESARWHATDLIFPREASKDVELEGVEIPQGSLVHMCLGSANRDPERWENPTKFDIFRPVQRATAFGGGPHSCLGQHVSRQEMVVALNAILDRLPNLRWDASKPPPRLTGGLFQRGPTALPVVFG